MRDLIGRTLGHDRIVDKIGEGGMGEVYRALDERLDREVAVKVLPAEVSDDLDRLARFEREAKAVARLDHSNILAIHDFVTSDGRVKVLDFGLAQMKEPVDVEAETASLTPAGTAAGTVLGTMGYMSPEQLRGEPADARSDIFALGCVLYEMLSGRTAFLRKSSAETTAAILREEPPSISDSIRDLPPELERAIARCLEKGPDERFQSARDLAYSLRSISSGSAPHAARPGPRVGKGRRVAWWAAGGVDEIKTFDRGLAAALGSA